MHHPFTRAFVQICASILGSEWSPVLSVVSVCVTIQSMLASCKVRSSHGQGHTALLMVDAIPSRRRNGE